MCLNEIELCDMLTFLGLVVNTTTPLWMRKGGGHAIRSFNEHDVTLLNDAGLRI